MHKMKQQQQQQQIATDSYSYNKYFQSVTSIGVDGKMCTLKR